MLEAFLWLSLNVYHEARGESHMGQMAVAHVTLNRAASSGESIKEVVNKPFQFTWTMQSSETKWPGDFSAFTESMRAVIDAVEGYDFTMGANHYHNGTVKPEWAKEMKYIGTIDNHLFYRGFYFK